MPKAKETPAQKIRRLERELSNEKLKNQVLNKMIDISDKQYGIGIRKSFYPINLILRQEQGISLLRCCRLFGISRQAVCQSDERKRKRAKELSRIKSLIIQIRGTMPRIGTPKLYHLLKDEVEHKGIKIGRDTLFDYLRSESMLVKPKKNDTKTTDSKHWLRKYPILMKEARPTRPEQYFVSDIIHVKSRERTHFIGNRCL